MIRTRFDPTPAWRVIASRHPPVALFENVANEEEYEALYEVEAAFSPHYDETLLLRHLPRTEWVYGPGAGYIMAPFAYRADSRFSDGSFGVFYAGLDEDTAIREVAFHRGAFLARTSEPLTLLEQQVLRAQVAGELVDIRSETTAHPEWYDPDPRGYGPAQALGGQLRGEGETGLAYASVRNPGGGCVGLFRPKAVTHCRLVRPLRYVWDGTRISGWY